MSIETTEALGWTSEALAKVERLRGWTPEAIARLRLRYHEPTGRVVFSIRESDGSEVELIRYQPDPSQLNGARKALATPGVPRQLFPAVADLSEDELTGLLWLCEGESDAVRLWSLGLPAVGVPGAHIWRDEWAASFAGLGQTIVVCFDSDPPGRANAPKAAAALIRQGVEARILDLGRDRDDGFDVTALTWTETEQHDREGWAAFLTGLAEEAPTFTPEVPEADGGEHTWQALDLVRLGSEQPEPPSIGGLLYPGRRHVVSGEFEAGKSWLLLAIAAELIGEGRGTVWIDSDDMGAGATLERLRSLGAADEAITRRFAYLRPSEPLGEAAAAYVADLIAKRNVALVVFDAFTSSLTLEDLDPNSGRDVQTFYRRVVGPFTALGPAVALTDHVVKRAEERGRYSIGSERKMSGADVHIALRPIEPFARGRTGRSKIVVHRDRPGFLRAEPPGLFVLTSERDSEADDPETYSCSSHIAPDHAVTAEGGEFRPTNLMERVSRYLELASGQPRSRNEVEQGVKGKGKYVRQAIDVLIGEGFAVEEKGERGARLVQLVRSYREADEETEPWTP